MSSNTLRKPSRSCQTAEPVCCSKLPRVPKRLIRTSGRSLGTPMRRNSLMRIDPPSAVANSAVSLLKVLPHIDTSASNTPSSSRSANPTHETDVAYEPVTASTFAIECVG